MDIVTDTSGRKQRNLQVILVFIILATLPFYCFGFVLLAVRPASSAGASRTETPTPLGFITATAGTNGFASVTPLSTLQPTPTQFIFFASPTPLIVQPTVPLFPTFTPTFPIFPSPTPPIFVPPSLTPLPTITPFIPTSTPVPSTATFTPTLTPTITIIAPTETPIPFPTPIPTTSDFPTPTQDIFPPTTSP